MALLMATLAKGNRPPKLFPQTYATNVSVAQTATTDFNVRLRRTAFAGTVTMTVTGLPANCTASFPDGQTFTGGAVQRSIRLSATEAATAGASTTATITFSGAGVPDATLTITCTILSAASRQLPVGHFEPAVMPMTLVYPRPAGETASGSRYKWAYPNIEYRIPISIQGGSYPLSFSLESGPAGMAVGEWIDSANYGIVTWTPTGSEVGAQSCEVLVSDQEGNVLTVSWSVTVDANQFLFVDPNSVTNGVGTLANPFNTWTGPFGTTDSSTTHAEKIVYFREGTTDVVGYASTNNNASMSTSAKPRTMLGYPGEDARIDCTTAIINYLFTAADLFVAQLRFENSRADVPNSRFFFIGGGTGTRLTWFETYFYNHTRGTADTGNIDNPGPIVMFTPGNNTYFNYQIIQGCTFEGYEDALCVLYSRRYVLYENNLVLAATTTGDSASVRHGLYTKSRCDKVSYRRNVSIINQFTRGALTFWFATDGEVFDPRTVEMCYNVLVYTPAEEQMIQNSALASTGIAGDEMHIYRNTIMGYIDSSTITGLWDIYVTRNVFLSTDGDGVIGSKFTLSDNVRWDRPGLGVNVSASDFKLIGASRTTYLGTHGHEISE